MAERKRKPQDSSTPFVVDRASNHANPTDTETLHEQPFPEAVLETAEILADSKMMAALDRSTEDLRAGRLVPLDQVERELGL